MNRGETVQNVILWIGTILAGLILFNWGAQNIHPVSQVSTTVSSDLTNLQLRSSNACTSIEYTSRYNPRTEDGRLIVDNDTVTRLCIATQRLNRCVSLPCPASSANISLDNRTYVSVEYYDGLTIT